jgi:adenylate cyclase
LGDIVERDGDVFGDGVNIAARLQNLAEPDTICILRKVYEEVAKKIDLGTVVSLGKPTLKNIAERFQVYALLPEAPKGIRQTLQVQHLRLSRRIRPVHWLSAAGLLLIVGTVVTVRYFPVLLPNPQPPASSTQSLPLPDKPSIVVLPFTNMSNDPDQEYFSDGMTEDITTDLSKIASLFVISRNSAFTYKGKAVKVQDVGQEMGVRYVLEGSVRKADNRVRITAQLIDAATGEHLWAERFDRPFKDIFALQDELVRKIVTTMQLQLTLEEQGIIIRKRTDSLDAYDTVLHGLEYFYRNTKETNVQARQLFEKAVALDSQYAEAYAWLGYAYWIERRFRWSADPKNLKRALALAQQTLTLNDSLPPAHTLLGQVYTEKQQPEPALALI